MKCLVCGGRMSHQEHTTFTHTFSEGGRTFYVIITDVPAEVCGQCEEKVYAPEVTEQVVRIVQRVREGKPPPQTVEVPLYSLPQPV